MDNMKVKVCPSCQEKNPPNLFECAKCGADLTGVMPVDMEQEVDSNPITKEEPEGAIIKVCDSCGAKNAPQARKCEACGEDISDVRPTQESEPTEDTINVQSFDLRAVEDDFIYTVDKPITVIGRKATLSEYLHDKTYVSREHIKIIIADGSALVENLSKTNYTFVNDSQIEDGVQVVLQEGDEIGLGGKLINDVRQKKAAYFIVEGLR